MDWQLAQVNIARFRKPADDPANADFMAALDHVNALAEASPGFVFYGGSRAMGIVHLSAAPRPPPPPGSLDRWTCSRSMIPTSRSTAAVPSPSSAARRRPTSSGLSRTRLAAATRRIARSGAPAASLSRRRSLAPPPFLPPLSPRLLLPRRRAARPADPPPPRALPPRPCPRPLCSSSRSLPSYPLLLFPPVPAAPPPPPPLPPPPPPPPPSPAQPCRCGKASMRWRRSSIATWIIAA